MIIQQAQIKPPKITEMLSGDPEKRNKIMKIVIQTLYNLGYEESALQLQKESNVIYMKPQIKQMKILLPSQRYQELEQFWNINKVKIPQQIRNIIVQLKCMKYIREGQVDKVLQILQADSPYEEQNNSLKRQTNNNNDVEIKNVDREGRNSNWEKMKEKLSEELMIGDGIIQENQLKEMHEFIIEKSLQSDIEPRSMQKILQKFVELQKLGLTTSLGFSLLGKSSSDFQDNRTFNQSDIKPPIKIIDTVHSMKSIKKILYIKFCPSSILNLFKNLKNKIFLVISGSRRQKWLSLWEVKQNSFSWNSKLHLLTEKQIELEQEIVSMSWCELVPHFIVATLNIIYVFKINVQKNQSNSFKLELFIKKTITCPQNRSDRLLCCQYNPLTNFYYIGSSAQSIMVYNQSLTQNILTIQPIFRTRVIKFLFNGTYMLAVSASKGIIVLYDLFQIKETSRFTVPDHQTQEILSLRVCDRFKSKSLEKGFMLSNIYGEGEQNSEKLIVVTEKKIYYITIKPQNDNTHNFTIQYTFNNPFSQEAQLTELEAMTYADKYLISLGEKQFHAYELTKYNSEISSSVKLEQSPDNKNLTGKLNAKQYKWQAKQSFTFDINHNLMVSGNKELMLWGYNPLNQNDVQITRQSVSKEQNPGLKSERDNRPRSPSSPSHSVEQYEQQVENQYEDQAQQAELIRENLLVRNQRRHPQIQQMRERIQFLQQQANRAQANRPQRLFIGNRVPLLPNIQMPANQQDDMQELDIELIDDNGSEDLDDENF